MISFQKFFIGTTNISNLKQLKLLSNVVIKLISVDKSLVIFCKYKYIQYTNKSMSKLNAVSSYFSRLNSEDCNSAEFIVRLRQNCEN